MPAVVRDYFPGGWHHHDREGRPVFLLRLGQMDVKGIVRSIGEEGLTKLTLHICEEGLRLSEESSHRLNKPITTWSMLLDLGRPRLILYDHLFFSISTLNIRWYSYKQCWGSVHFRADPDSEFADPHL